jgi:hypothetical protein
VFKKLNIYTISYLFNYFIPTFLMITFILFNHKTLGVEIGILSTFIIMITQIFSSNMRNLILSNEDINLSKIVIKFRLIFSLPILIFIYTFIEFFLHTQNRLFCLTLSILFIQFWIYEIVIVSYEISNNLKKLKIFNLISFFFIIQILILLSIKSKELVFWLAIGYILYLFLEIFKNYESSYFQNNKIKFLDLIKKNIISNSFISSFSMVVSNFIWRMSIIFFVGKSVASIYFLSFAIASLPGTIVNNFFGISFLKQKIKIKLFYKLIFISLWLIMIIINFNFDKIVDYTIIHIETTHLRVTLISLIGSFFMINAMYTRVKMISFLNLNENHVFKIDVIYGVFISFVIPVLYFIDEEYISYAYLVASVLSFFLYNLSYRKNVR